MGVAKVDITPDYPVRLSGFGFRREEATGVTERIWAKALAFGDAKEGPAILITADNLCVPDEITKEIARRLAPKVGVKLERLSITATHTHTAPMLKDVCPTLFGVPIPAEHQTNINRYTGEFVDKLESVAVEAVKAIRPARVSFGIGKAGFAMNRRTKGGPVDHDLPLLAIHEPDGNLRAIYFSYACHCVTLSDNQISGDWAGFAQKFIEEENAGIIALASVGCGADSNPNSGVTGDKVEVCRAQGQEIATEVKRLLGGKLKAITSAPVTKHSRVQIAFDMERTRAEWEERAKLQDAVGHHARVTLEKLDRGEKLPEHMDYPIQTWIFGKELAMVFLPGETVVDYSLRLKREFDKSRIWVNGYANEGRCYVPSERILQEGGYEGGGAMIYYDFPNRFAPGLEEKIVAAVQVQVPETFKAPAGTEGTRPLEPEEALESFTTRPGMVVELAAAEPLIQDPISIEWGPDGKLWVCEMHDYPSGTDNNWQPGGRVKWLEDRDGDGKYERAVLFAENLPFPTGLMAWNGGLLICAAPDVLFARDENGDGKADKIERLFSGFATDNFQARVNSLALGLDNWIYAANGLLGGTISTERNSLWPERTAAAVDIRNRDLRFEPRTGVLETVSGLTQQGRARDDWGNWFGCDNTRLLLHFPRPDHYMRRNPQVQTPNPIHLTTRGAEGSRVYPTSPLMERFNDPDYANRATSACGIGVYRDTLLGEEYYGNVFTCEPVHNLVHREVLSGGLVFNSRRAEGEEQSEFLRSSDNWFRPAQARMGPDGAVYVVDMYRFLIEHPRWIPVERLAKIDIRAGADRGRIYRVRRKEAELRPVRDLTGMKIEALAGALDSPNGTERDRVHAELLRRGDKGATATLAKLGREAKLPHVRLQALSVLLGLGALSEELTLERMRDEHPGVREFAVQLAEPMMKGGSSRILDAVLGLAKDNSIRVQRQVAYTLGEAKDVRAGKALAEIALKNIGNAEMRAAVMSSAVPHCEALFEAIQLRANEPGAEDWMNGLVATAAATRNETVLVTAIRRALPAKGDEIEAQGLGKIAKLLGALAKDESLRRKLFPQGSEQSERLTGTLSTVRGMASDTTETEPVRESAIQLIAVAGEDTDRELLADLAVGDVPSVRAAALRALREQRSTEIATALLERWDKASPGARAEIMSLLVERTDWSIALLEAVRRGKIEPKFVSLAHRQRLAANSVAEVRKMAGDLLAEQGSGTRANVLAEYRSVLAMTGDAGRGAKVFAEQCASCHQFNGTGHAVGPDLATLRVKDVEYWIKNILDPNAVIEPRFIAYNAELEDDRVVSGVIKSESSTGVTMVSGNGVTETIGRTELRSLKASSLSLMPEGLEQTIKPEQMADLLAYLRGAGAPKEVSGNKPTLVTADREGAFMLGANAAEIYGDQITFESEFRNIGLWHSAGDYVSWKADVKRAGQYEVYLDYACASGSAGNEYVISCENSELNGKVSATGPDWSSYRQLKVGQLRLELGTQQISLRPQGEVRGALIDLRTLALVPAGHLPKWPVRMAVAQDEVLRDAASVARVILDSSRSQAARETAVQANPQFAAALIVELTRGLQPGTPEEYVRIPWIWRVAIAAARRNDTGQLRAMLAASLPEKDGELHDWQAVVIGGGVINGISERGIAPGPRVLEIIGGDTSLRERWERALALASSMADNSKVPNGTRYDALRMLGVETWEKRGAQLARYLGKDVDGELQMGAVSGLADMRSREADRALSGAIDNLTEQNRKLASEALKGREEKR